MRKFLFAAAAVLALASCAHETEKAVLLPRSLQTENLIAVWDEGFGDDLSVAPEYKGHDMTVDLPRLMDKAEYFYRFYRDRMHFIGKGSLADSLKMIVNLRYDDEATAYGGDYDGKIGALWVTPLRTRDTTFNCIAHELGHSFQSQLCIDTGSGFAGGGIYEMTSQWMLWNVNDDWMTTENYHWTAFMDRTHLAFMHPDNMYHSPYVLEYWSEKRGLTVIADLWRAARQRHDVVEVYEEFTGLDDAAFGQEMYEFASHSMAYDFPRIREVAAPYANRHNSTLEAPGPDGWRRIASGREPQQFGYNGICLDVPGAGETVCVALRGDDSCGDEAGWRFGLVAVKEDGSCVYSESALAVVGKDASVSLAMPEGTAYLWLTVVATPSRHVDVLEWQAEILLSYPYRVLISR